MQNLTKIPQVRSTMFVLILTFFCYIGCASQVEEKQQESDSELRNMPPPPEKKLSPGTAKIEALMLDTTEEAEHFACIIKVEKVLAYGAATKPIGKGKEIFLQIPKDEYELVEILSEGLLDQKYEFIIEQEEIITMSTNQLRWRVVKVRKIDIDQ